MWRNMQLKDLCAVFTDGDWIETKDQSSEGVRLVQTGNVKVGCFADRGDKARHVSEETFKRLNCTEVKKGDILVSRLPEPVGRACIVPNLAEKLITAVDCTIVRTTTDVLPVYLNYYMQSPQYFSSVKEKVTGATRQRISRKNLGEINIFLPPIAEQQHIVSNLDAAFAEIDAAIKLVEAKGANAERLKASLLDESLKGDDAMWKTVKLGELYDVGSSKRVLKADWQDEGIPFYRGREITELSAKGYVDNDLFITEEHYQTLLSKHGVPNVDDLMITAIGTIGNTYIVQPNQKFYFKDASVLWLRKKTDVSSYYIQYWLKANEFFGQLDKGNGATVDTLTIKKLASVVLPLPTLADQQRIVAKLDAAFAEIETVLATTTMAIDNYTALKSSLLARELSPSEAA